MSVPIFSSLYLGNLLRRRRFSDAARRHVAKDLSTDSDEDDAVSGGISFVPFDLAVRDDDSFSRPAVGTAERLIRTVVGDDGHVAIPIDLVAVGPICVCL